MAHLHETQVLRFLIQFTLLFVLARALADVMKRLGQATVIGEIVAGIILGQTILGHFAPGLHSLIFPGDPMQDHLLEAGSWLGVILLLVHAGLETDLDILRGVGRTAAGVSWLGIIVPWVGGFTLGWYIPASYLPGGGERLVFSLFMAVAMSISAVPVIAKILMDLDLMRRDVGLVILAAGVLDDTVGWLMLSVVAGLATRGVVNPQSLGSTLGAVVAFAGFCYFIGGSFVVRLMRWVDDRGLAEHAGMSAMVGIAMVCAIITQAIGIHAVFGAFVAGLMLGRSSRLRKADRMELEAATIGVFAPIFFAYSGLKVDMFALHGLTMLSLVLAIAIAGKLVGCTAGSLIFGLQWRESLAVGVGMNARGGMEIIVALIGLHLGVLTPEMYAIIIIMAIVTSLMTPPLLSWVLARVERRPEELQRLEREKLMARLPFDHAGAKLLVLSGGGPNVQLAAHLAAIMASQPDASITLFHATANSGEKVEGSNGKFPAIKAVAELSGARNILQRTGSAPTVSEAIVKEIERGYDAIFAGASIFEGQSGIGGGILRELVSQAQAPVVIVRDLGAPIPLRKVLVPTTGAPFSQVAAAMAMLYAHTTGADVTVLHVNERPGFSLRDLYRRHIGASNGGLITAELRQLGAELGVTVQTQVASGARPERAIIAAAQRGGFDLLVMGVLFRPSEGRAYFGPKVDYILRSAGCALALVVQPEQQTPRA